MFSLPNLHAMNRPPMLILGAEHDFLVPAFLVQATGQSYGLPVHIFRDMGHAVTHEKEWRWPQPGCATGLMAGCGIRQVALPILQLPFFPPLLITSATCRQCMTKTKTKNQPDSRCDPRQAGTPTRWWAPSRNFSRLVADIDSFDQRGRAPGAARTIGQHGAA
jgi:hypothetical protein